MNLSQPPDSRPTDADNISRKRARGPDDVSDRASSTTSSPVLSSEVVINALKRKIMEMASELDASKGQVSSMEAALKMEKREHELKTSKLTSLIHQKQELQHKCQVAETDVRNLRDTVSQMQVQAQALQPKKAETDSSWLEISSLRDTIAELQAQNQMIKKVKIDQFNEKMDKLEKENEHLRALVAHYLGGGSTATSSPPISQATAAAPTEKPEVQGRDSKEAEAAMELARMALPLEVQLPSGAAAHPPSPASAECTPQLQQQPVQPRVQQPAPPSRRTSGSSSCSTECTPQLQHQPVQPRVQQPAPPSRRASGSSSGSAGAPLKNAEPRVVTTTGATRTSSVTSIMVSNPTTTTSRKYVSGVPSSNVHVLQPSRASPPRGEQATSSGNAKRSLLMDQNPLSTPYGYAKGAIYVA